MTLKISKLGEWLAIALASVLLLLALELSLRLWERWQSGTWPSTQMESFYQEIEESFSLYRRHAFLNTSPREGHRATAFGKEAAFNSLGYRSPERAVEKSPEIFRILVSGGSTSFDLLAEDNASTWPARLEDKLRQSGCQAEVWNAGFPGWTSAENAISLLLRDLDLRPDLAILFQGINDLQPASLSPFDSHYESHAAEARRALGFELPPLGLFERSLLLEKIRGPSAANPWQRVGPGDSGERLEELPPVSLEIFRRHARGFSSLAEGAGAHVMLATQTLRLRAGQEEGDRRYLGGWLPGLTPDAAPRELERLNQVMRELAAQGHQDLVDLARDITWQDPDFGDAMHFSAAGSEKVADRFAAAILETGLCQTSLSAPKAEKN